MSAITIRINTVLLVLVLLTGLAIVAMLATRTFGGPLDPPLAPASTDGVRQPGTPISSIPFTAATPGRYYLTRDLTAGAGGTHGVTISASDVTLDLNGFTLRGIAGSINGVFVSGARSGIRIQNGNIRAWFNGIDASTGSYTNISNVGVFDGGTASGDGSYGILAGAHSVIEDCRVSNNKASGILAFKITIRDCSLTANGNDGIRAVGSALLQNNYARGNSTASPGLYADLRLIGKHTYASENTLGDIILDADTEAGQNLLERNLYCGAQLAGSFSEDTWFELLPTSEGNLSTCIPPP